MPAYRERVYFCPDQNGQPGSQQTVVAEAMSRWETMLKGASWVIVESYEWESGME